MSKEGFGAPFFYRWVASLVAAGLLMLLWAGCGESDSETAGGSEPLSKPQFVKQANGICERALREKDEAVQQALAKAAETQQKSSRRDLEGIISQVVLPRFEETTNELAELTPPAKEAGTVEGILRKFEDALKETEEDPGKMLNSNPFLAPSEAAEAYGLTACRF